MRKSSFAFAVVLLSSPVVSLAQEAPVRHFKSRVMIPESSVERPGDIGVKVHTHLRYLMPIEGRFRKAVQPNEKPPFAGLFFETPASIACVYHLVRNPLPGCNPDQTTENPTGGGGALALVEAFDDPTAAGDLQTFSTQFGLPKADLNIVFSNGKPSIDPSGGGELETSLDIEWAHAMAPKAKLFLVEAPSLSFDDIFAAIVVASNLVSSNGGGEVSMSFGGGEFPQETQLDPIFTAPNVVFVASAGDAPGAQYPSSSPNVVSAGGTTISRDSSTGSFLFENAWQDTGGGPSEFEPRPDFQDTIAQIVRNRRGTPDLSFDSNPNTGVWVFDSNSVFGTGWFVVGGTSVAAPSLAGIINSAGHFADSSQAENQNIYHHIGNPTDFRDIFFGNCGLNIGTFAFLGYDFCTGVGSPIGLHAK